MCVKEFLGYNCGHCSIPFLRQCPLTDSNPSFPPCKFPAERPIFTNENCHACSRVLWNKKVLEEEARHRVLHEQSLCHCEVIFDTEERGRRMRPRAGKGKGKMKEIASEEYHGYDATSTGEGSGARGQNAAENPTNRPNRSNYTVPAEHERQRQEDWEAQIAAYEYLGYIFTGNGRLGGALGHVEKGHGFPEGGFVRPEQLWEGQLRIGQPGAGMKFYPEQAPPTHPMLPALPPIPGPMAFTVPNPRNWQRASSEPAESTEYAESVNDTPRAGHAELKEVIERPNMETVESTNTAVSEQIAPVVVSSEMATAVSQ